MLDEQLKKIQEIDTYGEKISATLHFGKLPDGKYALAADHKGELGKQRGMISKLFRSMPFIVIFNDEKQLKILDKIEEPVDTTFYTGLKADKLYRNMKILSKGVGTFEGSVHTLVIRNINLKPFKPKSNFVVRFDPWVLGSVSKTTNELPSNVYYRTKMKKDIHEFIDPVTITAFTIATLAFNLAMLFFMFGVYIANSKRDKTLEKKFNDILKDGKQWKVYIIKDASPNAFCMTNPVVFMTTGFRDMLSEEEVIAILLHEAGHIKNKDLWKNISLKYTFLGILTAIAWAAPMVLAVQIGIAIIFISSLYGLDSTIIAITFGRKAERRADSTAVKYGYGKEMASALDKIDKWVQKIQSKRPCLKLCQIATKVSDMLDEHPPLQERVKDVLEETETWKPQTFKSISNAKNYFMKSLAKK